MSKKSLIRLSNNLFNSVSQCIFELNNLSLISMTNYSYFPLPKLDNDKLYIEQIGHISK